MSHPSSARHDKRREELARGYSYTKRIIDVFAIVAFFICEIILLINIIPDLFHHSLIVIPALLFGFIAADFTSGFVHWLGDTWGSPETPILGKAFIRPFREHHVDQTAITRHDFVETNGSNCLASLIPLVPSIAILLTLPHTTLVIFLLSAATALSLGVFGTNQFHKWAHLAHPPIVIAKLQSWKLVLPPKHHAVHHTFPHDRYYCITVGWLNKHLERWHFFAGLERLVTRVTGAIAREDDKELLAK